MMHLVNLGDSGKIPQAQYVNFILYISYWITEDFKSYMFNSMVHGASANECVHTRVAMKA